MSIIEVKVPQLSESVSEATLLTWHKQVGDAVLEGENLIDVETDKVVMELPASKSGILSKIIKGDGEKVGSEELIALIDTAATAHVVEKVSAVATPAAAEIPSAVPPSVRKLAHALDVDTSGLQGSGRAGRVTRDDVLSAMQQVAAPQAVTAPVGNRVEQRVPMTRIRQRIAERLLQSQQNAAILTTFNEVNMPSRKNTASSWVFPAFSSKPPCTPYRSSRSSMPRWMALTSSITAISTSALRSAASAAWSCPLSGMPINCRLPTSKNRSSISARVPV
jgi:pyruvate/2-oxoglutarate dehydrogenase complex dihydrolipoamide acyltransferase (E2) component